MTKVLFLYVQLSGYMAACINRLANTGIEVHVVYYEPRPNVPFKIEFEPSVSLYSREKYNLLKINGLIEQLSPSVILCCGWIDKGYLLLMHRFSAKCNTVVMLDTVWSGNFRQRIGALIFKIFLRKSFSFAWVPSILSDEVMHKLGFSKENIIYGLYCADDALFNLTNSEINKNRFLFAGRHANEKGLNILLEAYSIYKEQFDGAFANLHIFGGTKTSNPDHEGIVFHGFIQPCNLAKEFKKGGIVIVPSREEPWGVVVQEALNCGLWVIASERVGAAQVLVVPGQNGDIFNIGDVNDLVNALKNAHLKKDNNLSPLSPSSDYSVDNWVEKFNRFLV